VSGGPESTTTNAGVPAPREPADAHLQQSAATPDEAPTRWSAGIPARVARPVAAVRQWFSNSAIGRLWHRLQLLDFINRGTLFAAVLLLSFVPFLITLQALEGRSVTTAVIRRFGLDRQAADDVGHVFTSASNASHAITGLSWVFFILGGLGAAAALQELYEHAFGLDRRGIRDTLRHLAWLATVVVAGALANWAGPWLHQVGSLLLYGAAALVAGTGFWWFTMWLLLAGRRGWRRLFPSALATGVCWVAATVVFRVTLSGMITSDYARYGPIGVVFAIMSVLVVIGLVIILGALAGVVWEERRAARAGQHHAPDGRRSGPLHATRDSDEG
jgi:membrane protein